MDKACPDCGTGAIRLDPIAYPALDSSVPQPKLRGKIFVTLNFEWIVAQEIAERIEDMCPGSTRPILHSKTNEFLPFAQVIEQATLPPFNKEKTKGYERSQHRLGMGCSKCNRDGFYNIPKVPLQLVYDSIQSEMHQLDILATWECFGKTRWRAERPFLAMPVYVVSERIAAILRPLSHVELEPIECNSQ